MFRTYLFFITTLFIFSACRQDPEPPTGFSQSTYTSADFEGATYIWESSSEEIHVGWNPNEEGHAEWNILNGDSGDLEIALHFGKSIERSDITELEGKRIASGPGNGFPYLKVFWISDKDYTNSVEEIDYGTSIVNIEEVINTGRKNYKEPLSGEEKRGRTYIVRGNFDMNISIASWSATEPVILYPFSNGQFSMRLVVPD